MKYLILLTALVSLTSLSHAADINAGKAKAAACGACHGQAGISSNPAWPNLAGQKALYLKNQMIAFRDGTRQNAMMSPMAKALSDEDAANLAAYYESLKP